MLDVLGQRGNKMGPGIDDVHVHSQAQRRCLVNRLIYLPFELFINHLYSFQFQRIGSACPGGHSPIAATTAGSVFPLDTTLKLNSFLPMNDTVA